MARQRARERTEAPGALRTLQDLPKAARRGEVSSLYLLFGEERYLLDRLEEELLEALLPKKTPLRDLNLETLDGSVASVEELTTRAETMPMGGNRRVVVVHDPAFLGAGKEPTAAERLARARDAYEAGNVGRALALLFAALELEPVPLDTAEVRGKIASLRAEVVEADPDLATFLDDAPEGFREVPLPEAAGGASPLDRFLEWAAHGIPETTVVVLIVRGVVTGKRLLDRFNAIGTVANVDTLRGTDRRGRDPVALFIQKQLKAAKCSIEPNALARLRERTNDDLQTIVDEIEKLAASVGEGGTIRLDDVEEIVSDAATRTVFDLMDAIGNRRLEPALECLHRILAQGEPALKIHALFVRQVRLMLQARLLQDEGLLNGFSPSMPYKNFMSVFYRKWPADLMERLPSGAALNLLKQKPYPCYLAFRQAERFKTAELLRAYDLLLEADEALKTGSGNETFILQETVRRLVRGDRIEREPNRTTDRKAMR